MSDNNALRKDCFPFYIIYDSKCDKTNYATGGSRVILFVYDGKRNYYRKIWYDLDHNRRQNLLEEPPALHSKRGIWDISSLANPNGIVEECGWFYFYSDEEFLKDYSWLLFL